MMSVQTTALETSAVSPWRELGAYEALWTRAGATFKSIADMFRMEPDALPSNFVSREVAAKFAEDALRILHNAQVAKFGVRVHGAFEYPERLREAVHPVELLYYQGGWDLVNGRCIAVVGSRKPSEKALRLTKELVTQLVLENFIITSGLARGIDSVAHQTAIEAGGATIGVLGTSLSQSYPAENRDLQREIAANHLLISQVPIVRSASQGPDRNRVFFPERNVTMSALTEATVIVEAGETSGTLVQARAAIRQGRRLFILDHCFESPTISWPQKFLELGAIRVKTYNDIRMNLNGKVEQSRRTDFSQRGSLLPFPRS